MGDRIRAQRLYINRPCVVAAQQIGVSKQMLDRYERGLGNPPATTLSRIALALGTSSSALLGERDPQGARGDEIAAMTAVLADPLIGAIVRIVVGLPDDRRELARVMIAGLVVKSRPVERVEVMR
jgi:transcriptional regulator with XRE-family HTH domain